MFTWGWTVVDPIFFYPTVWGWYLQPMMAIFGWFLLGFTTLATALARFPIHRVRWADLTSSLHKINSSVSKMCFCLFLPVENVTNQTYPNIVGSSPAPTNQEVFSKKMWKVPNCGYIYIYNNSIIYIYITIYNYIYTIYIYIPYVWIYIYIP